MKLFLEAAGGVVANLPGFQDLLGDGGALPSELVGGKCFTNI